MRIGFDARALESTRKTGVEWYKERLIDALIKKDHVNEYMLFFTSLTRNKPIARISQAPNVEVKMAPLPHVIAGDNFSKVWFDYYLPLAMKRCHIDIFHGLSFCVPATKSIGKVVTIHDLQVFIMSELMPGGEVYRKWTERSIKRADRIIVPSEYVRNMINKYFPQYSYKVRVVYSGIDIDRYYVTKDKAVLDEFRKKYNLPEQYILYVGASNLRKNVGAIIKAYQQLKKEKAVNVRLVLAGPTLAEEVKRQIKETDLGNDVIYVGYIPEESMACLYNCASMFVFPSLEEGFGFPALEAMACGVPVIASTAGSLPEVVGDAGILVEPRDINSIAEAMNTLLTNTDCRKVLREKGLLRVQAFSWENTVKKTISVYQEIERPEMRKDDDIES